MANILILLAEVVPLSLSGNFFPLTGLKMLSLSLSIVPTLIKTIRFGGVLLLPFNNRFWRNELV